MMATDHVECLSDDCGCMTCLWDTKEHAITAWNTRAPDTAPSQSADLIAELERNATWRNDRHECVTSSDLLRRAVTALRAAEADAMTWKVAMAQAEEREARLREALQWIERRGSPQSYADMPHRLSEVMAEIARRTLGGEE
jgi:hypothetical protein